MANKTLLIAIPFEPMERMVIEKASKKAGLSFEDYVKGNALSYAFQDAKGGKKCN